jgi:hypothetical protein
VFIDPFDAHAGDPSSIKVFKKLAKRGIPVILWYPLLAPDDRLELPEKGLRCELRTVGGVPGLHGCGMAFRNLSEEAEAAIYSEALEISRILRAPITVSHDGRTIISDVIINRRSGNVLADRLPPAASNKVLRSPPQQIDRPSAARRSSERKPRPDMFGCAGRCHRSPRS